MSAVNRPDHLLTLDEWDALADDDTYRWAELVEGVLQMSPSPSVKHQRAMVQLAQQLDAALASHDLVAVCDIDVVLVAEFPPTVRAPDVVVVPGVVLEGDPARFVAPDVLMAVEITSPGSRRIDRIMKSTDYADAGIRNYWIVDLDERVTLDAFHLVDGRYEPVVQAASGRVSLDGPVPLTVDLDALVP